MNNEITRDVGRDLNVAKNYSGDKTIMFGIRELVANWFVYYNVIRSIYLMVV